MFNIFNLKAQCVNTLMVFILVLSACVAAQKIYYSTKLSDACLSEPSIFYPSPDQKWFAKLTAFKCPDSPERREVFLVRRLNDRISILIYSSFYETSMAMNLAWKSADELIISIPDSVQPDFPAQQYAKINVSYASY